MHLPINYVKASWTDRRQAREEYVFRQAGLCWYCKNPLNGEASKIVMESPIRARLFPDGFFKNPIHLHHNHDTDMTIGAVHARCNAYLWQYCGE